MRITQNYLEQLELNQLSELAKFVVEENFNHHCDEDIAAIHSFNQDILNTYYEELSYFEDSKTFVSKDEGGNFYGSIRLIKWNYKIQLPIQKLFNINLLEIIKQKSISSVWHIGRFATSKNNSDRFLFKKLMMYAIAPICTSSNSIGFAECDNKLLRAMNLMGIQTETLGNSITYLGSETIPISIEKEGVIDFFNTNYNLLDTNYLDQLTRNQ
ncbi:hypothetical protein SAMN05421846_105195 [Chryseobacterium taeanense]|uniref:GNAT family N-acetyltransferase n=1 Tax=Chryseobacterium taeanense TaxID=311334 RepID=A0A1G8J2C3_9FLAO|nr:hypothetical protein [Chryseobacterium taeanense]SDI25213.1 hypothetical protein SAMN05421846_105195 [Chryseobacterium taeanense]